ncbi:MAG: hypothetical protein ACLTKE_09020 [Coprococcus sp.]
MTKKIGRYVRNVLALADQIGDALHSTYPEWFLYGSETASAVNSRGVYTTKANAALDQDKQLTSYDKSKVSWGASCRRVKS